MHGGHNAAYRLLNAFKLCIDSDDFMPDDAFEKIYESSYPTLKDKSQIAGTLLSANKKGAILTEDPKKLQEQPYITYKQAGVISDKQIGVQKAWYSNTHLILFFEGERLCRWAIVPSH